MKLFVTGANGYIGGSVAARLVQEGHHVRGLVRNPEKVAGVEAFGIEAVVGTLDDAALLTREANAADGVINAADSDSREAVDTFIAALAGSGKVFIHTSGSSIVGDNGNGEANENVYDEDHLPAAEPDKIARRAIDQAVVDAATQNIRSIVLCNTLIYGATLGPPAESVQLPRIITDARQSGVAHYIGKGFNIYSNVYIGDAVDMYLLALQAAPAGFFAFIENGEASFKDMAQAIADSLGLGVAQSLPLDEAIAKWGYEVATFALASNSRVRSVRTRPLGWQPSGPDVMEYLRGITA